MIITYWEERVLLQVHRSFVELEHEFRTYTMIVIKDIFVNVNLDLTHSLKGLHINERNSHFLAIHRYFTLTSFYYCYTVHC